MPRAIRARTCAEDRGLAVSISLPAATVIAPGDGDEASTPSRRAPLEQRDTRTSGTGSRVRLAAKAAGEKFNPFGGRRPFANHCRGLEDSARSRHLARPVRTAGSSIPPNPGFEKRHRYAPRADV